MSSNRIRATWTVQNQIIKQFIQHVPWQSVRLNTMLFPLNIMGACAHKWIWSGGVQVYMFPPRVEGIISTVLITKRTVSSGKISLLEHPVGRFSGASPHPQQAQRGLMHDINPYDIGCQVPKKEMVHPTCTVDMV